MGVMEASLPRQGGIQQTKLAKIAPAAKGKTETSAAQSDKRADGSSSSVRKFETQGVEVAAGLRSLRILDGCFRRTVCNRGPEGTCLTTPPIT